VTRTDSSYTKVVIGFDASREGAMKENSMMERVLFQVPNGYGGMDLEDKELRNEGR
jgi:hypothetical protein